MDPVSIASISASMISQGIGTTQNLADFYNTIKEQTELVRSTAARLQRLLDLLKSLKSQLDGHKPELLEKIAKYIDTCYKIIVESQKANDGIACNLNHSTLQKLDEAILEAVSDLSLTLQLRQPEDIANVQEGVGALKPRRK